MRTVPCDPPKHSATVWPQSTTLRLRGQSPGHRTSRRDCSTACGAPFEPNITLRRWLEASALLTNRAFVKSHIAPMRSRGQPPPLAAIERACLPSGTEVITARQQSVSWRRCPAAWRWAVWANGRGSIAGRGLSELARRELHRVLHRVFWKSASFPRISTVVQIPCPPPRLLFTYDSRLACRVLS